MQFSFAITVVVAGVAVKALPSTESSKTVAESDNNIEARGFSDGLLGGLGSGRSSSTSSSSTSTSSVSSSTSSAASSATTSSISSSTWIPTSSATAEVPTDGDVKTYGNDVITTIQTAGTTGDRRGFKWTPVDA